MDRREFSDLVAEHLFPHLGLLQRSAVMLAINAAPAEAFDGIGELWTEGTRILETEGPAGLQTFLAAHDAPQSLIDLVMSYAK